MPSETLQILVVEDNPVDVMMLKDQLCDSEICPFRIKTVDSLAQAVSALSQQDFSAVLLDLGLPDSNGLDTFLELKKEASDTPVVVLSGMDDESLAIDALRHGAQDYLVKGRWEEPPVARAIAYAIERQRLTERLIETERPLRNMEKNLRRMTRALAAVTQCSHALIHATDEASFLQDVCRIIVEIGGYRMAWIGLAVDAEMKTVRPVAMSGVDDGCFGPATVTWLGGEIDRRLSRTSNRAPKGRTKRQNHENSLCEPRVFETLKHDSLSSLALPLEDRGSWHGALSIYANHTDAFDNEEIELLTQLAADLSYGINTLRLQEERKRVEESLAKEKAFTDMMLENLPGIFYLFDYKGRMLRWNKRSEEISGYSAEEIAQRAILDFVPLDEHHDVLQAIELAFSNGEACIEGHLLTKSGRKEPCLFTGKRVIIDETPCLIGMGVDISERKRAEAALTTAEARNQLLIQESPVGIAIVQDGKLTYVNPAARKLFQLADDDDVTGMRLGNFVAAEDKASIRKAYNAYLTGNTLPVSMEVRCLKRNGEVLDTVVWPRGIDYLGRPAILVFIADQSEAKRLRSQLLHAQKMEAVGTLAGGMAHDFNNLLTITSGFSEILLQKKSPDHPDYSDLKKIVEASEKGAALVRNLLSFSRKTEIKLRPVDLNHEARQVVTLLSRTIPKTIDIHLDLAENLDPIQADPGLIEQILVNLAFNAKDAMRETGILTIRTSNISLEVAHREKDYQIMPGRYVLLSVADTGEGMDQGTLGRIFEPFYTTKRPGHGTGLGLAMVYGVVKQHGGWITCNSAPGEGTEFHIYFPAIAREETEPFHSNDSTRFDGSETILLVDDDEHVREVGKRILISAGYSVLTASDEKEALERLARHPGEVSLLILDLLMCRMRGQERMEELLKSYPKLKVLVIGGYPEAPSVRACLEAGAQAFVTKPFKMEQLSKAVRKALDEN
jgi:PAS domain S-box-containing protein